MKKSANILWGIIIGTIAGIVIGSLFNDNKDRKDKKIKKFLNKETENLKENIRNIKEKINKNFNTLKLSIWNKKKNNNEILDKVEDELGT